MFETRISNLKSYLVELVSAPAGFTCIAVENEGSASAHITNIQIECALSAPVVTLSESIVITEGEIATIFANTAYLDSQKGTLSYEWTHISGDHLQYEDNGDNISLVAPNESMAGVYQVTVTDANQQSSSDIINISVNRKSGFQLPASIVGEALKPLELSVTNVTDESINTLAYQWEILDRDDLSLEYSDTQNPTVNRLPKAGEAFVIRLTITDEHGKATVDSVIVTVNATPKANAGLDQVITAGESFTLSSSSSVDSDGHIESVEWRENDSILSTDMDFTLSNVVVGVRTFTLIVVDNDGARHSDSVDVMINALPIMIPPVADAGIDQLISGDSLVTFNGSGSEDDGTIVSY